MVELTSRQGSIGRVLRAGAALLSEGNLREEEDSEVREQMNLLNSRWEHLRVTSMERQSRCVHAPAMGRSPAGVSRVGRSSTSPSL